MNVRTSTCLGVLFLVSSSPGCDTLGPVSDVQGIEDATTEIVAPANPFLEMEELGLTQYFGTASPVDEVTTNGVTTYVFDPADGPMCLRGDPFQFAVRDQGSNDLLIFLQGGGACWTDFCFTIETAPAGMPLLDVLDTDSECNPFADWNMVYLPYCDGSMFAGDVVIDEDDDGTADRFQTGLKNLSAAIDVAVDLYPAPDRITLGGSSGGGFGTIIATVLVRARFPGVPLFVVNDSGVGIVNAADPSFLGGLLDEFNIRRFLPASCVDCVDNGHLTRLVEWELQQDPDLKIAAFSYQQDLIIADLFLDIGGEEFQAALLAETDHLNGLFPDRYVQFLPVGTSHTGLLGNVEGFLGELPGDGPDIANIVTLGGLESTVVDGITLGEWLERMLTNAPPWTPVVESD